jgi:glycerol-3-phosphate acyltransferase PlsX
LAQDSYRARHYNGFDVGAMLTVSLNLLQFAVMGSVFANHIYGIDNPKIGLLSVGEEKNQG